MPPIRSARLRLSFAMGRLRFVKDAETPRVPFREDPIECSYGTVGVLRFHLRWIFDVVGSVSVLFTRVQSTATPPKLAVQDFDPDFMASTNESISDCVGPAFGRSVCGLSASGLA